MSEGVIRGNFLRRLSAVAAAVAIGPLAFPGIAQAPTARAASKPKSAVAIFYLFDEPSLHQYLKTLPSRRGVQYIFCNTIADKQTTAEMHAAGASFKFAATFNLMGKAKVIPNWETAKPKALHADIVKWWRARSANSDYWAFNETPSRISSNPQAMHQITLLLNDLRLVTHKPGILFIQNANGKIVGNRMVYGFPRGETAAGKAFRAAARRDTKYLVAEHYNSYAYVDAHSVAYLRQQYFDFQDYLARSGQNQHKAVTLVSSYRGPLMRSGKGVLRHQERWGGCPTDTVGAAQADAYIDKLIAAAGANTEAYPRIAFGPVAQRTHLGTGQNNRYIGHQLARWLD